MTMPNDAAYAQLDAWVAAHFDEEVSFLQALVRVPTDTPPGLNAPHARRTAELLAAFGFDPESHAVPEAQVREYGLQSLTNLVVRRAYGEGAGARVIGLNAHGDVVPPGEGWTQDPYGGEIVDGPDGDVPWCVGDLVGFGVGHPCTTFDKWPLLYTVDDGYRVLAGIRTFF